MSEYQPEIQESAPDFPLSGESGPDGSQEQQETDGASETATQESADTPVPAGSVHTFQVIHREKGGDPDSGFHQATSPEMTADDARQWITDSLG